MRSNENGHNNNNNYSKKDEGNKIDIIVIVSHLLLHSMGL